MIVLQQLVTGGNTQSYVGLRLTGVFRAGRVFSSYDSWL